MYEYVRIDRSHLRAACAGLLTAGLPDPGARAVALIVAYCEHVRPDSAFIAGDDLYRYLRELAALHADAAWQEALGAGARLAGFDWRMPNA